MLFTILNFFFTAIIVILFVRYFVEKYRFYGFGPVMVAVITLTERLIKPLKRILPRGAYYLEEQMPLVAIAVVLFIRGLVIWVLGESTLNDMVRIHGVGGRISLPPAMAVSFSMGVLLVTELLLAFLFASVMVSRRGITMMGNAGFMCFQERTFAVFRFVQKWIPTDNLAQLFLLSAAVIWPVGSFFGTLLSGTFLYGSQAFLVTWVINLFEVVLALITIYWFVLLLAIVASWIGADRLSTVVQVVRAMADPYLDIFRRALPWARIDFIDLSPIFAFLCLNPGLVYLLIYLKSLMLRSLWSPALLI